MFITDDRTAAAGDDNTGDDGTVCLEWIFILQGLPVQCDYITWYIIHMNLLHWCRQSIHGTQHTGRTAGWYVTDMSNSWVSDLYNFVNCGKLYTGGLYGIQGMTVLGGKQGVNINSVLLMLCVRLVTKARNMEILALYAAGNKTVACVLLAVWDDILGGVLHRSFCNISCFVVKWRYHNAVLNSLDGMK